MWPAGFFFPIVFWPVGFWPLTTITPGAGGGSHIIVACAPALGPGYGYEVICHPLPGVT
jgi:hypothetical protein